MSDSRAILLRLSVRDADVVRRELVAMGEQGSAALARLDAAAKAAGGSGAGASGGGFGGLRGAIGQAGFQIQDFAVQVQGGTSALTALSQQGSQLLGIFGPAGAIAGAALTVGILAAQFLDLGGATQRAEAAEKAYADAVARSNGFLQTAIERTRTLNNTRRGEEVGTLDQSLEGLRARFRDVVDQQAALRGTNDSPDAQAFVSSNITPADRERLRILDAQEGLLRGRIAELEARLIATAEGASGEERDQAEQLRRTLNERYGIQREYEERVAQLRQLASRGLFSRAEQEAGEADAARKRDEALRQLAERGLTGTRAGTSDQLRNTMMTLRGQEDERLRREVERFTQGVERPLDAYKRRVQEIENLAARARENGNPIPEEAIQRATDEALGQFNNLARGMEQSNLLGQQLGMTFNSAFEDMIVKGRSFREVLGGIAQDLARLVVRQSITAPLGNMLTKAIGGFDFGSIFSFGGGKAVGGPVMGGTTYLVGERGPELFMPAANGNIVPNHALGGVTIQQHVTINAQGAGPREIDVLRAQIPGMVRQTALAAVEDASRRGGGFARNVRGG